MLITSRAHADWRSLNARRIALDVWERTESHAFLRARTGEQDTLVLDAVADALGDLPLALEQAAAYANTKAITLNGNLQRLGARAGELLAVGQPLGGNLGNVQRQLASSRRPGRSSSVYSRFSRGAAKSRRVPFHAGEGAQPAARR